MSESVGSNWSKAGTFPTGANPQWADPSFVAKALGITTGMITCRRCDKLLYVTAGAAAKNGKGMCNPVCKGKPALVLEMQTNPYDLPEEEK